MSGDGEESEQYVTETMALADRNSPGRKVLRPFVTGEGG